MGPWSKLAACVCLGTLVIDPARAAVGVRLGPAVAPVTPAARPLPRPVPGIRAGHFGRAFFAGGRRRRGFGLGGLGVAGLGLDSLGYGLDAGVGDGAAPPIGAEGPPLPPPVVLPVPPACPLIIKVGRGLDHPARTRVVYGRPVCR